MASRPRVTAPRTFEDFQPLSNLLQEEECETLIIDLPGFRKEQIRVQMDDRSGTVMISGERPTGNNRWNRFRKELRVPNNCNTNEIQAKFENGVLRIMMPVKPDHKKQEVHVPKPIPPPPPPPTRKPDIQPRPTPAQKPVPETKPTPTLPPPQSRNPVIVSKPTPILPPPPPPPIRPKLPVPKPEMSEKLTSTPAPQHPLSPKTPTEFKPVPEQLPPLIPKPTADQKNEKHIDLKTDEQEDGTSKMVKEKKSIYKGDDEGKYMARTSERPKKEKEVKDDQEVKDEIKESVAHGVEGGTKMVAMDEESKRSIVNMVAAVLVVIALCLYIRYTIKTPW